MPVRGSERGSFNREECVTLYNGKPFFVRLDVSVPCLCGESTPWHVCALAFSTTVAVVPAATRVPLVSVALPASPKSVRECGKRSSE